MDNVYFVHQIYHNKTTGTWNKGIVVKDTENTDNKAAALQAWHAYLSAYAYDHNPDIDYVYCEVSDTSGRRTIAKEVWPEQY